MPREDENQGRNPSPNLDAPRESIINDPTATQSTQMGVRADIDKKDNPFHLTRRTNDTMKDFEKLMRGDVAE